MRGKGKSIATHHRPPWARWTAGVNSHKTTINREIVVRKGLYCGCRGKMAILFCIVLPSAVQKRFSLLFGVYEKNKGIVPGLIPYSFDGVEKKIN